ncbi:MAG: toxin-antitoxin system HicB family antitoxin [Acidobacteriota bacterium]|nr:toxin-antitoxin system HicB family antitoxin [Acidobacteriota bacterium]
MKRTMKKKAEKKVQEKDLSYYLNHRYKVEIVPFNDEDGGGYEARIPQLGREAFRGYGDTIEEALAHLDVVKRDLFEMYLRGGVQIPEPEKDEERYSGRILLRIPFYLHEELSKLAKEQDISLNQLLNHLIERGLASLKYENEVETMSQTMLQVFNEWRKPPYRINLQDVDFAPQPTVNENKNIYRKSLC